VEQLKSASHFKILANNKHPSLLLVGIKLDRKYFTILMFVNKVSIRIGVETILTIEATNFDDFSAVGKSAREAAKTKETSCGKFTTILNNQTSEDPFIWLGC
jgi:hypothetical protein